MTSHKINYTNKLRKRILKEKKTSNKKFNNCTGQCVENISYYKGTSFFVLELKPRYKNKIEFLNTLSHEMLHLWQQTIKHDTGRHNKLFFSFKNKFKNLNLILSY